LTHPAQDVINIGPVPEVCSLVRCPTAQTNPTRPNRHSFSLYVLRWKRGRKSGDMNLQRTISRKSMRRSKITRR